MTHFDNLLKAAFEAGRERAESESLWTNLDNGVYVGEVPDFDEWRASLSGLDIEARGRIKVGDVVRIVGGSRYYDPIRNAHHKVLSRWGDTRIGGPMWVISTQLGEYCVPEDFIEKVEPPKKEPIKVGDIVIVADGVEAPYRDLVGKSVEVTEPWGSAHWCVREENSPVHRVLHESQLLR